ncbi:hypothetical protein LX59_00772 [Azomonas agilis]|uniref:Uncharacterized protein n=1 Tax=Azomonas agilis TaxID=116849 RepID=A0A562J0Q3_9GAMM|nr:hypothetical protein [Azomonas agilis]TWH76727.1 hypothetical protein LX59_00772 [Azomonas agilis]
MLSKPKSIITKAISEFITLALLVTFVPAAVLFDMLNLKTVGELSVTQVSQTLLLFASSFIFWLHAWKFPEYRGFCVLVAGFFSCMLIREQDGLFDYVYHGFWFWPAMLLSTVCILYASTLGKKSVLRPMAYFIDTKAYYHIIFGVLIVLVFSRIFGSGRMIWKHIMIAEYSYDYKAALQEGLELLGYIFIAYGSYIFHRQKAHTELSNQ